MSSNKITKQKHNNLERQYNNALRKFNNLYKQSLEKVKQTQLNIQNNPNEVVNVFVNNPAVPSNPTFEGCYINLEKNMTQQQDGSTWSCARNAALNGHNFFALSDTDANGWGKCYTSAALDLNNKVKSVTSNIIWQSNTEAGDSNYIFNMKLGNDGVIYLLNSDKRTMWSTKDDLIVPNSCSKYDMPYINNVVGYINKLCNVDRETTNDAIEETNTYETTNYLQGQINDFSFQQSMDLKNYIDQPLPGLDFGKCNTMNLKIAYQCGNYPEKLISMDDYKPTEVFQFNCNDEKEKCTFFLKLEDDGNLNVYQGNPDEENNVIVYSSNTTQTNNGETTNLAFKSEMQKYDRSILFPGETIKKGEFLFSDSGMYMLTLLEDNNLVIYENVLDCLTDKKNNIPSNTFSVFKTTGASNNYLGKVARVNKTKKTIQNYDPTLVGFIDSYTKHVNTESTSHTIDSQPNTTIDECKVFCNKNMDCAGFSYNNSTKSCILKNKTAPEIVGNLSTDVDTYARNKNVLGRCDFPYETINSQQYSQLSQIQGDLKTDGCAVNIISDEEYKQLEMAYLKLKILARKMEKATITNEKENKTLKQSRVNLVKKMENDVKFIKKYNKSNRNNERFNDYVAQEQTSKRLMISSNYKYMMTSILAIIVVFACIKIMKN